MERREIGWSMQFLKPHIPSIEKKVALVITNIKGWRRIPPGDTLRSLEQTVVQEQVLKSITVLSCWAKLLP